MEGISASTVRGITLTVLASILWGTSFLFIGFGLQSTDPYTLAFMRFALTSVIILPISLLYKGLNVLAELKRPGIWILGIVNALGYLFQFVGQNLSTAAEASLLSTLYPVIVPFFAFAFLKDRISGRQKISTVLGFAGLILVMLPELDIHSLHFLGDILLFFTSIAYALFIVIGKKEGSSSADSIFALMVVDTLILFFPALFLGNIGSIFAFNTIGWAVVLWLAFPCTLIATSVYLRGLKYLPASQSATVLFLELVTGFVLSVAVFGEPHLLIRSIGAAVISVSIIISSFDTSSKKGGDKTKEQLSTHI